MSLSTLRTIAVQRDQSAPQRAKTKPMSATEARETEERSYINVLVGAIPSEPLALYTFLVGSIVATIDEGESDRLGMRWAIYGCMMLFIVLWLGIAYYRDRATGKRRFPWVETASASVAFAAWGLVMPGSPLSVELSGDDWVVWTGIITVLGVGLLGLLGVSLKQEVKS
jgi:hypothetical protein